MKNFGEFVTRVAIYFAAFWLILAGLKSNVAKKYMGSVANFLTKPF